MALKLTIFSNMFKVEIMINYGLSFQPAVTYTTVFHVFKYFFDAPAVIRK